MNGTTQNKNIKQKFTEIEHDNMNNYMIAYNVLKYN